MTRDEIMALEAGPVIDRFVLKRVMGFEKLPFPAVPEWQRPTENGVETLYEVPRYSEDMSAAWKVVEKVTDVPRTIQEAERMANTRFMFWWQSAAVWAMKAEEAALEICRAALLAVESGEE